MAFGGSQRESLTRDLLAAVSSSKTESKMSEDTARKCENPSFAFMRQQDETVRFLKKGSEDSPCCKFGDKKINDFSDSNISEKNADEINQSSDSLSSSASISDSDLTSTDSEDSLALSESESITDVTPLNSPYCDSPLPQSRHVDHKSEDKVMASCRSIDYEGSGDNCHRPEMNVLMRAIEKIELEAKSSECGARENIVKRRGGSFANDEAKRIEQENQRLFKRVISQQNRIRSMYASSTQPSSRNISCRSHESGKNDGDISLSKKSITGKFPKQGDKTQAHRKQKCISHPSSFMYSCNHAADKSLFADGSSCGGSGKKKYIHASGMKIACSPKTEKRCDEDL